MYVEIVKNSNSFAAYFLKLDSFYSAWSSDDKKICIVT